jgi:penicillin amidase
MHKLTLRNPIFSGSRVGTPSFPTGGDGLTINNGHYRYTRPFQHSIGSTLRTIVDFSDPGHPYYVLLGGNSGHPMSPHYRDQIPLWREGKLCRL